MNILAIETSCDETGVSIIQADGGLDSPTFRVLGDGLYSQMVLHAQYGGVYPNLARREHAKNLTPLLEKALKESNFLQNKEDNNSSPIPNSLFFILNYFWQSARSVRTVISTLCRHARTPARSAGRR